MALYLCHPAVDLQPSHGASIILLNIATGVAPGHCLALVGTNLIILDQTTTIIETGIYLFKRFTISVLPYWIVANVSAAIYKKKHPFGMLL